MDFFLSNRFLIYAIAAVAQAFLIVSIWRLPQRKRRAMLLAYVGVAIFQSVATTWLAAVRQNPNQIYTSAQELVFYISFATKPLEWALCFGVVHESLNAFLTPYRALRVVGQRLFRIGMGAAAALVISSALMAPQKTREALSFLYRSEPLLIYGAAIGLLASVALFVWYFQLKGSANDSVAFSASFLIFGSFTFLWAAQHLFQIPATSGIGEALRVAVAVPILVGAGLRFSKAGDAAPLPAVIDVAEPRTRQALEMLNASLERVVKS